MITRTLRASKPVFPLVALPSKRISAIAGAAALALGASSASAQILYEPFDYGSSAIGTNYANTTGSTAFQGYLNPTTNLPWASALSAASGDPRVIAGSQPQIGGLAAFVGDRGGTDALIGSKQPRVGIVSGGFNQPGTTLYYSLAVQLTDLTGLTTSPFIVGGFNNSTGTQAGAANQIGTRLQVRLDAADSTKYNIGVGNNNTGITWDTTQFSTSDNVFVVGSYSINGTALAGGTTGADDTQSIWINPSSTSFGAGTAPAPTITAPTGVANNDIQTALTSFLFRTVGAGNSSPTGIRYDELRVDRTWAQVTPASGSTFTAGSSADWSNAGAWDAGGVPDGAAKFAYFRGAGGTINVDSGQTIGTLTFRSQNSYTVASTGGTLTFNPDTGGTAAINVQPAMEPVIAAGIIPASHAITAPVSLASNLAINAGLSQALSISGGVSGTGTIAKAGPGTVNISNVSHTGNISSSGGNLNLTGGVNHNGNVLGTAGTVTLSGTNGYTGTTTFIGAGATGTNVLAVDGDASLGAVPGSPTANIFLSKPTAGLTFRFNAPTTLHANRTIVISQTGGGNGPVWDTGVNDVTVNGNITASTAVNLMKQGGTGTLFLRGDNSTASGGNYVGAVFVNIGTLNVTSDVNLGRTVANGGGGVINLSAGAALQFGLSFPWASRTITFGSGGIGGTLDTPLGVTQTIDTPFAGNAGFTKSGEGTLIVTAAPVNTSGNTTVRGGTLTYSGAGTLGLEAGSLTVSNPNTGPGTAVVLNLPTSVPTTKTTLSGTVATPTTGTNTATINNGGQLFTINQAIAGNYGGSIAGTGAFKLSSTSTAALTLSGPSTYSGGTQVDASTLIVGHGDALGTGPVTIANAATVQAQAGLAKAISIASLTTAGTGKFDLTNSAAVIKNSTLATVTGQIVQGYNNGDFLGAGITSSTAANDPNFLTAVGYASNLDAAFITFEGVSGLDDGDVLVKYTYYGDADLTGSVDLDDFNLFLAGYQDPANVPQTWIYGDFDYTGSVDLDDFNLFLAAYQANGAQLSTLANGIELSGLSAGDQQMMLAAIAAVPEPGTLGALALAAGGLLARRRGR
jgi:fibronectin-binding autotransporter adhesin